MRASAVVPLSARQLAVGVGREVARAFVAHRTQDVAAQIAFWALLAVFPFGMFVLTVIGYVPLEGLDRQVMGLVYEVMPTDAAKLVDHTVHEVVGRQRGGLLLLSLVGWVWSAAGGMGTMAHAINTAHGLVETRGFARRRLLFLGLTLGAAGAIVVSTLGIVLGPGLVEDAASIVGLTESWQHAWRLMRWPIVILSVHAMLAALYHFLPAKRERFRLFTVGSVVALGVWLLTSLVFNYYVRHFHAYAKTYGTLGGAVALLIWLYLTGIAIVLGAEIDAAWARLRRR
jgi:membrane protein